MYSSETTAKWFKRNRALHVINNSNGRSAVDIACMSYDEKALIQHRQSHPKFDVWKYSKLTIGIVALMVDGLLHVAQWGESCTITGSALTLHCYKAQVVHWLLIYSVSKGIYMILLILISQLTALHLRYVTLYLLLLFLGRHNYLTNRWVFSPNLPERWQMGCIRKLKLLDSEFFRGLEEDTKVSLFSGPSWTQLHEIEHGDRKDLPVEKRNLAVWSWPDTFFLPNSRNCEKMRPLVRLFSGTLLNRERLSLFLSPSGATL